MIVKLWMHVLIPYQNIMIDKEHGFYFLFIFMMWLLIPSFEFVQFGVPRDWDSSRWPPVFLYLYGFLQIHSSCLQWWMFNRYISFWVHIYFYWGGGVLFTLDNVSLTRKKEHAKNDANVKKKVNENSLVKYKFIML